MRKRILIADDNSSIRDVLRGLLKDTPGLELCGEAVNGVSTLEMAWKLEPDLIVLDLSMPKMEGAVITSALKRRLPRTKIILFTMYGDDLGRPLLSSLEVDAVLSKPNGMGQLVAIINSLLD